MVSEQDFDSSKISDEANTDKPKREKRPSSSSSKKAKSDVFPVDDCTNKIFQLYKLWCRIARSGEQHKPKDFQEEGAALSRLSEKYAVVGLVLKSLDPLFFIIGTGNKFAHAFSEMRQRKATEKAVRQAAANGQGVIEINPQQQGVNPYEQFAAH